MLYIRSSDLIYLITELWYPFANLSLFTPPFSHFSTLFLSARHFFDSTNKWYWWGNLIHLALSLTLVKRVQAAFNLELINSDSWDKISLSTQSCELRGFQSGLQEWALGEQGPPFPHVLWVLLVRASVVSPPPMCVLKTQGPSMHLWCSPFSSPLQGFVFCIQPPWSPWTSTQRHLQALSGFPSMLWDLETQSSKLGQLEVSPGLVPGSQGLVSFTSKQKMK